MRDGHGAGSLWPVRAVLYDIHGNLAALEAVVADARAAGASRFVLGGDYGMLGPEPAQTLTLIDSLPVDLVLRGNTERWVAQLDADDIPNDTIRAACAYVAEAQGAANVQRLAALPDTAELDGFAFAHASPGSDMRGFLSEPIGDEDVLVVGLAAPTLVVGHTHQQFRRQVGDVEVVNPGSVGLPLDGDTRAAYALWHDDGTLELRRVAYDSAAIATALDAIATEWSTLAANRVRTASL